MIEAEIQASTDSTLIRSEDGLVGYWNFDDETAKDLTVYGHDNNKLQGMPKLSVLPPHWLWRTGLPIWTPI